MTDTKHARSPLDESWPDAPFEVWEPTRRERVVMWIRYRIARLICRLRGHAMHGGKTWTDCGYEYWAECKRCGDQF